MNYYSGWGRNEVRYLFGHKILVGKFVDSCAVQRLDVDMYLVHHFYEDLCELWINYQKLLFEEKVPRTFSSTIIESESGEFKSGIKLASQLHVVLW